MESRAPDPRQAPFSELAFPNAPPVRTLNDIRSPDAVSLENEGTGRREGDVPTDACELGKRLGSAFGNFQHPAPLGNSEIRESNA